MKCFLIAFMGVVMNLAAVFHRTCAPWCFAQDDQTLVFRLQTAPNDVTAAELLVGDPFDWVKANEADTQQFLWNAEKLPLTKTGSDGLHDWWEVRWSPPYR
ncbi:MAG: hypothetical protein HKM06_08385, partial [Spirochaetales bacterium]|nr:hypothetical protein [Spirochaetales bacterium]